MVYVYKLINQQNIVEYIGATKDPEYRFKSHTIYKHNSPFCNRKDLQLIIVDQFETRKEAFAAEKKLKKEYNLFIGEEVGPKSRRKFTEEEVKDIKNQYLNNNITQRQLAKQYNVAPMTINGILTNKTYA